MVRFETGEGLLREIIAALQSLSLSRCADNSYCGGTTNICVWVWVWPLLLAVFLETADPLFHDNYLTILWKNDKGSKSKIFQNNLQIG